MPIIAPIPRDERRLMQKAIHKTHDKNYARRLTAMLMLHRGDRVSDVARTLCCARSSVGRWINWFTLSGVAGLKSLPAGRTRRWPFEHICTLLREPVKHAPGDFGYQRSRWSTERLAIYQPVYSPRMNHVERLWQALHDTITRNHQCRSMWQLLKKVRHFMETVSPFPGGKHGLAKV
ncbi:helix-turn-helix domain-containing protein [Salmonella enterica]|nr:helix-turn-helix domain-containing protein [Salmonella enterica]EBP3941442.1 helix-turn-helix domain-containing protein [Salmonella enterica subsp. enterica]ECK8231444.1 helix-turn-helix domain-containing protein [Salmonella enterica subsp. houtenae]AXD29645.1 hypothetical protein CHD54_14900 [Salmonella enterica]EAN8734045.1 helix-turn-helix domain-containing protein [Salmonella enterica]EAR7470228.1 helix-turn-helix domain-containing protein [Salmonella enterica]